MIQSARSPEGFADAYAKVAAANRLTLDKLAALLREFERRGIECLLLKGCDLVTRIYPTLGQRQIGDVDLLVHEADLPRVDEAARALGLKPDINGNAAYIDEDRSFLVDIFDSIWYLEDDGAIWDRSVARKGLGLVVRAMEATDALFFICAWTCLHRAYFTANFPGDVALLVKSEPIDWKHFCAEASRLRLKLAVKHSLDYARAKRPFAVPDSVGAALAPSGILERVQLGFLRRLVTGRRLFGLSHALMYLTKPRRSRLSSIRAAFWPERRFMSYRYGDRGPAAMLAMRVLRPFYLAAQGLLLLGRIAGRLAGHE